MNVALPVFPGYETCKVSEPEGFTKYLHANRWSFIPRKTTVKRHSILIFIFLIWYLDIYVVFLSSDAVLKRRSFEYMVLVMDSHG